MPTAQRLPPRQRIGEDPELAPVPPEPPGRHLDKLPRPQPGRERRRMAAYSRVPHRELTEVDIFNGNCSEGEGDSFVNSVGSNSDGLPGFGAWTLSAGCPGGVIRGPSLLKDSEDIFCSSALAPAQLWASGLSQRPLVDPGAGTVCRQTSSIVDNLLTELYVSYTYSGRSIDSVDSSTEASSSDAFLGRSNSGSAFLQEFQEQRTAKHQVQYLAQKDVDELKRIVEELRYRIAVQSAKLVRQLRRKDNLSHKLQKNSDIVTACLQAVSQKRHFLDISSTTYLPALQLLHGNTCKFSIL